MKTKPFKAYCPEKEKRGDVKVWARNPTAAVKLAAKHLRVPASKVKVFEVS